MIRIKKLPQPAIFNSRAMRDAVASLRASYQQDVRLVRQSRAVVRFPDLDGIKQALLNESHRKCAYCEQRLTPTRPLQIDHFRPARGAMSARGERSEQHYYWLAYEWSNLYACCPECNHAKGGKFPVASERLPVGIMSDDLDGYESPMILNPALSDPDDHLQFHLDGKVTPRTTKGQFTIDVLRLNREGLIVARSNHIEMLRNDADIERQCLDTAEFAGLTRSLVASYPTHFGLTVDSVRLFTTRKDENAVVVKTAAELLFDEVGGAEKEKQAYYASFPMISSIHVRGIYGLTNVEIGIPSSQSGRPGCLVLLGENGVGKSSILKATVLALYDHSAIKYLGVVPNDILNAGESEGLVRVVFDTGEVSEVRIVRDAVVIDVRNQVPVQILAYGPTRLLPTKKVIHVSESELSQAKNLFDPFSPLQDPTEWLMSSDVQRFDYTAAAIKALLDLPDDSQLHRSDDSRAPILIEAFGTRLPLEHLSHGYKSALALICDVMATLFKRWTSMDAAQGIVFIDEVESHLHPAWKLRIVTGLRAAFPRVQFVITTHDPLCLRGFEAGEVAVLMRRRGVEGVTVAQEALPAVSDMRIDQILTSTFFGLRSTVDPDVERLFEVYNDLLMRESGLNDDERYRLESLRAEVAKHDMPALLPRDRVMYGVIDKYLASRKGPVPANPQEFDAGLRSLIDEIVRDLPDSEGGTE